MAILAFDTSSKACTIALGTNEKLLIEYTLNLDYTHSDYLLPLIKEALRVADLTINELDAIGVVKGPGSFTGLRIGLTVAKGLAIAANCPIYSFTSLEVLAASYWGVKEPVIATIPAQRGQVYVGQFNCSEGKPKLINDYFIGKLQNEISDLILAHDKVHLISNDNKANTQEIVSLFANKVINNTPFHSYSRASLILPLVVDAIKNKQKPCNTETVEPFYMRLSAAEEQRLERETKNVKS